jgi:hypothetical protein
MKYTTCRHFNPSTDTESKYRIMSTPGLQIPSNHDALELDKGVTQSLNQPEPKDSNSNEANVTGISSSNSTGSVISTNSLREFLASLQKPPDGKYFRSLCSDGVFRILTWQPTPPDLPTGIAMYDGLPMSPDLIKAYLDRKPWNQETEDRFRGVDGRTVPQEQWLRPLPGVLPCLGSENEREKRKEDERIQLEERSARGEMCEGPVCGSVQSDYDLRPR